ncbi:MAG: flagellar hook-length control protein FliK [Oligoflexia bacterium]|nr:flagellar hook-length control protein FliK [Oligoflexia bacterium]
MAQESISSIPFFPDIATVRNASARKSENTALLDKTASRSKSQADDTFDSSLGDAMKAKNNSRTQSLAKADKPKLGNREPFFPQTRMPYHPSKGQSGNIKTQFYQDAAPASNSNASNEVNSADGLMTASETALGVEETESPDTQDYSAFSVGDDKNGVMAQSYEAAAVSYPIRQVAPHLDEEAKSSLQEQGLWNTPVMVMAQPDQKTSLMAQAVETQPVQSQAAVPVQKPIIQFMASLENEVGVSPDRLVKAFEQLPQGAMQKPPEQTMVQVIQNLNLQSEDQQKAVNLYSKMLAQMESVDQNEQLKAAPLLAGGLTTQKIAQQADLNAVQAPIALKESVANRYAQNIDQTKATETQNSVAKPEGDSAQVADRKTSDATLPLGTTAGKFADGKNQEFANQGQNQSGNQPQGQPNQTLVKQNIAKFDKASIKDEVKFDSQKENLASGVDVKSNVVNMHEVNHHGAKQEVNNLQNLTAVNTVAASQVEGAPTTQDAKHEAIKSIISNAQMLAQKGGGEMSMILNPENLGEIQLRVAMDGQRVDVQMMTEKNEVKKLLEQNIGELRQGLAQHNLSMEKIDVSVNDKNTGNHNQNRPDFSAARDFANQFSQQNQNRRDNMLDLGQLRPQVKSLARPAMVSTAGARASTAKGMSRLDVVA